MIGVVLGGWVGFCYMFGHSLFEEYSSNYSIVVASYYTDYSPEKIKEIYEKAHLNVLT